MGALTAVMFFVSVLLHELGHSLVAMRFKVQVPRITLFIFGRGLTNRRRTSKRWRRVLDRGCGAYCQLRPCSTVSRAATFVNDHQSAAGRRQIPGPHQWHACPLQSHSRIPVGRRTGFSRDRVGRLRNFRRATLIAADTGRFIGFLFIAFGVWLALRGNFFNGLWIAFIGWFLESAAAAQVQQQVMQGLCRPQGIRGDGPRLRHHPCRYNARKSGARPHLNPWAHELCDHERF